MRLLTVRCNRQLRTQQALADAAEAKLAKFTTEVETARQVNQSVNRDLMLAIIVGPVLLHIRMR